MSTGRVIANALRSFAGDRSEDCPYRDLVLLVELATNDSASRSSLGSGYMPGPFYADRGQQWTQHPSRPLAPPDGPDPAAPDESSEIAAVLTGSITSEALLQERQDRCKAELDRPDVQFASRDWVLLVGARHGTHAASLAVADRCSPRAG